MQKMKTYRLLASLIILAVLVAACGGGNPSATQAPAASQAPAVKSTELNLYAWSEYIPQALLEGFTQKTGVKVNYDTYSSNEELQAKLQAGGSGYDLIIPSDYMVSILKKQGSLEKLDPAQIPNLKNIDPKFKSMEYDTNFEYTVPYQWGTTCLVVNTSKVTRPITKWADLWSPEFKGKVVLLDDSREVIGMVLQVLGYDKNSTDPAQLEKAKAKLTELMPNVKLFDSDNPKQALLAGEVWIGQTWNGEAAIAHKENDAIQYVFPEEGCGIWVDNLAMVKGAPHADAAMAFINYLLEPENSLLITAEFPYSSPNAAALELMKTKDPAAYQAYMSYAATNPTPDQLSKTVPVKDIGDATTLWDRIWTEVKGNQ
jgi:spermidine/putrescine transport system substrate-binding protein